MSLPCFSCHGIIIITPLCECILCGAECESVMHALWECPAYSSCRLEFLEKLQEILGETCSDFDTLSNLEKTSYILGSELWAQKDFSYLLTVVKEFIVEVWELRKYCKEACPGPQSDFSGWDWGQDGN